LFSHDTFECSYLLFRAKNYDLSNGDGRDDLPFMFLIGEVVEQGIFGLK
jgi:hypothetical protein